MRKSSIFLMLTAGGCLLLAALLGIHPALCFPLADKRMETTRQLVGRLGLTDICLFTEATYLRHPTLADRYTPFQNHPMAMSHFPSESLISPPPHLHPNARKEVP